MPIHTLSTQCIAESLRRSSPALNEHCRRRLLSLTPAAGDRRLGFAHASLRRIGTCVLNTWSQTAGGYLLNQIDRLQARLHHAALPPLPARDLAVAVLASVGFVFYIIWMVLFLRRIRPALAGWLGRAFGVRIDERYRGQWAAVPPASRGLGCIVGLADSAILIGGALGPLIVLSLALLLMSGS